MTEDRQTLLDEIERLNKENANLASGGAAWAINAETFRSKAAAQEDALRGFCHAVDKLAAAVTRTQLGDEAADAMLELRNSMAVAHQIIGKPKVDLTSHDYTSTACQHGLHDRCRKECKFCNTHCRCACHAHKEAP